MNAKTTIRKILFIAIWVCIGGGLLTLLLAAIGKKNNGECNGYIIKVNKEENNLFIDKKNIIQVLEKKAGGKLKGKAISTFNLHDMESQIEKNNWVENAELFFDNKELLHINITEKKPVVRIFTINGNSFYLDADGKKLPLSEKRSARVPVFTGIQDAKRMTTRDSALLRDIVATAKFINADKFWMAQVAQIDITEDNNFEMIPVVGNNVIKLGDGKGLDRKFRRLFIFYQQVLSKAGFDKYKMIDVRFDGQVVASKQIENNKIDPVAYKQHVEKLIKESAEANETVKNITVGGKYELQADSVSAPVPELAEIEDKQQVKKEAVKSVGTGEKKTEKTVDQNKLIKPVPKPAKKTPKAIMPKKSTTEEENGGYN